MSSFPLTWLILLFVLVTCKEFEPYADNGGTIAGHNIMNEKKFHTLTIITCALGIAGKGYCIIATDTRLSGMHFLH